MKGNDWKAPKRASGGDAWPKRDKMMGKDE